MTEYRPQGSWLFLEKVDYEEEITTESGIVYKAKQVLDTVYVEATILAMGPGLPLPSGEIPTPEYSVGDKVLYDVRSRKGTYKEYDMIRMEDVVSIVDEDEAE
tara:strand:- start:3624 stop:3932 length:309 start_codon:yes stop_codon:yes gene_type:complete